MTSVLGGQKKNSPSLSSSSSFVSKRASKVCMLGSDGGGRMGEHGIDSHGDIELVGLSLH